MAKVRSIQTDYTLFREHYGMLKACLPRSEMEWTYFQSGVASDPNPVIFLHGTSGTCAAFFYQVDGLASKGYRVLSVQYPSYGCVEDWVKGFDLFLDVVKVRAAHIFGAGLGGFLGQHFAVSKPHRVRSLILCNSFASTRAFADRAGALSSMVNFTPTPLLRKIVLDSFPQGGYMELPVKQAIDWVANQVAEDMSGDDLAGRLSLNCTASVCDAVPLDQGRITLLESNGETMVPEEVRHEMRRRYKEARVAELKGGGDFPYLSQPSEVTLFIEVHMRGVGVYASESVPPAVAQAREDMAKRNSEGDEVAVLPNEVRKAYTASAAAEPPKQFEAPPPRPAPAPAPRPVWKNPFEDDDLL